MTGLDQHGELLDAEGALCLWGCRSSHLGKKETKVALVAVCWIGSRVGVEAADANTK